MLAVSIGNFDASAGVSTLNGWFYLRYFEPRLRFTMAENGGQPRAFLYGDSSVSRLWNPLISLQEVSSVVETTPVVIRVTASDMPNKEKLTNLALTYSWTVTTFQKHIDLTWFPFDKQLLNWGFSSYMHDKEVLLTPSTRFKGGSAVLAPNDISSGMFTCKGTPEECWKMVRVQRQVPMGTWSILVFTVTMDRYWLTYVFAWFIPMQLILIMSYGTYFLDPEGNGGRDGLTITTFLSMVFYQMDIKTHLPKLTCKFFGPHLCPT